MVEGSGVRTYICFTRLYRVKGLRYLQMFSFDLKISGFRVVFGVWFKCSDHVTLRDSMVLGFGCGFGGLGIACEAVVGFGVWGLGFRVLGFRVLGFCWGD